VNLNNINLELQGVEPVFGLHLLFGEYGGNLNVMVNGEFKNIANLADINATWIGGVRATVVNGFGNDQGSLELAGYLDQFYLGGQELYIDELALRSPLDMAFEITTCEGPIKWLQLPDMAHGVNIASLPPDRIAADDWLCNDGTPVTEVHFWGSYLSPEGREHWQQDNPGPPHSALPPPPVIETFLLRIFEDIPAGTDPEQPYSHPGELLFEFKIDPAEVRSRYWDSVPHRRPNGHLWWEHKFYYAAKLPEPFEQKEGAIYWLSISASPSSQDDWQWGWETSKDHWNDRAVVGNGRFWTELGPGGSRFEDLGFGSTYRVGDVFQTEEVPVAVTPFQWSNLVWDAGGFARVGNIGRAGGSGKELQVNNVNLGFGLLFPAETLELRFGEYGGNCNIRINGVLRNFANFADLDGTRIGGVDVSVVGGFGNDKGQIALQGPTWQLAVGGQELWIDALTFEAPVDMAFMLITEGDFKYCRGDFDRDGDVDGSDLAVFAADFGRTDCGCRLPVEIKP
jgi:hypothetical protein